jgi:hypothetical protein
MDELYNSENLSNCCEWCPDGEVMCGNPITHAGTKQLARVCDNCFILRAERNAQEDLSQSASEILAYAEERSRPVASVLRQAHTAPVVALCKDGDYCVYRPWRVPFDGSTPEECKALRDWKYVAYSRDLRLTAPATNPAKRKKDTAPSKVSHGFKLYRREPSQDVDRWLSDRREEHEIAAKAEKQSWQYGAVRGEKPKELNPVVRCICSDEKPHTDDGVTTWNAVVAQSSPLGADVYPLRLPVLTKIVGNKLFPRAESRVFEERYWWTRNIPMDGLGSIHEVKNFKRAFELMLQKKATLSPASPDYYAPATCYALWLSDQKPWLDQTEVLAFKPSKPATRKALELARYFSEPRDLPYDAATEQPAIRDLKYFLPSSTKPLGFLPATPKQNPRTRAWTLRRRWSDNGKRKEIELYLGRPASEEGTYIEKPSLEQFVQHCWDQASLATDEDEWLQWFCKAQALRMAGAGATDYGTEDTNKEDILQQQPKSFDTSYVVSRDLVLGENGVAYEVVKHKPDTAPTFVDDALDDERVSLGELSKALSRQEKEEPQPEAKPEQTPEPVAVEAEEVKPKPRYAFRSEYGPRLVPKKLESAKVMCIECSKPSAVNRFNQQTEWMKLRCGHERFLCLKCNGECHCK